jgi:hypothetical protein
MAYTPLTWTDDVTELSADNFNHMDGGIEEASSRLDVLEALTIATRLGALEAIGISAQTASYTLVLTDGLKAVEVNSASATNVTVPQNSSVAFPVGTAIEVTQLGAGQVTIVAGTGTTLRSASGLKLRAQYSSASLRKRATNEWVVSGDLTT